MREILFYDQKRSAKSNCVIMEALGIYGRLRIFQTRGRLGAQESALFKVGPTAGLPTQVPTYHELVKRSCPNVLIKR